MKLTEIIGDVPGTEFLYFDDAYTRVFNAKVLRAEPEKGKAYLILKRTAFHPKSGGQPSDRGRIWGPSFSMEVRKAMLVKGVVIHWGKILEGEVSKEEVAGEIDWNLRYLYMRRHTGGHLLDHCITALTGTPVKTTDAWHGEPCYVGYEGTPPQVKTVKEAVNMANRYLTTGANVKIESISHKEMLRVSPDAPNIYRLPQLKTYRVVTIEGCNPIPCGGTHLKNIREIKGITLQRVEDRGSGFRVYYDIS